jgi:glycosyltransferase involved in cell wall biosynthesis
MPSKRRLFVVAESLGIGGTESHLIRLLVPLAVRGWDIAVYCLSEPGLRAREISASGIKVFSAPITTDRSAGETRNPVKIGLAASRLFWLLLRLRPDIIHFYLPGPYLVGGPVSLAAGNPVKIMSRRSLARYQQRRPLAARIESWLHRHMDAVVGNSRAVVGELVAEGIAEEKIKLIYNGIETPATLPERGEARRKLELDPDALVGLMVANLISYKGHADLIEGLALVSRDLPSGWQFLIAGRDQGLRPKLERLVSERGIGSNVQFLGEYSAVSTLFAAADFAVLSSWEEGFSNVILEAMAAGLPMIVTDVGGNPEAVLDGKTGLVVPPRNPVALGEATVRLARDAGLRRWLGDAGRTRVEQEFSIERCVDAHVALYEEVLEAARKRRP